MSEDSFGFAVSLSGDGNILAVGAVGDDDMGDHSGSVYVFERTGGFWEENDKLLASDGTSGGLFGRNLSLSDDGQSLVVGANSEDDNEKQLGSVYVFVRFGALWEEDAKILDHF
jgi:hypothetical protein